jgi:elongation factor G
MNKMDRVGADFFGSIQMMKEKLGSNPLILQIPIGSEENFKGIVDLIKMKAVHWKSEDLGITFEYSDIPEELKKQSEKHRHELLEQIVEEDDEIPECYLEKGDVTEDEITKLIKLMTVHYKGVPVYCGASLKNIGVQPLIEGIINFLPSPIEIPPIEGIDPKTEKPLERICSDDEPLSALAFKIQSDTQAGILTYFRVYSGFIKNGTAVYNVNKNRRERINRIIRMYSHKMVNEDVIYAGDIGVAVGLKDIHTGDTLSNEGKKILLEKPVFPNPVISVAIEPKSAVDQGKLETALQRLAREDPTFTAKTDEETGQIIISGMGELHLDILTERLLKDFRVAANVGKPQVAYRETILKEASSEIRFQRQIAGKEHTGHVIISVYPIERGKGNQFENRASEEEIPKGFVESVRKGVFFAMERGVTSGYPVIDVHAVLEGGSFNPQTSSEIGYTAAASHAFDEACSKAGGILLEPYMFAEVTTPKDFVGEIIGDLNARGGHINNVMSRQVVEKIDVIAPLSKMFGYTTDLRSMSQGRATFTMEFWIRPHFSLHLYIEV